jgi:pyrimidine operon attenuation protein / uracil phosphoribosyltransferase
VHYAPSRKRGGIAVKRLFLHLMASKRTVILTARQIEQKINRIAWQIYENNAGEKEIFLAGIYENGFELAQRIGQVLEKISKIKTVVGEVRVDKKNPLGKNVKSTLKDKMFKDKVVILVDDVLNSGKTLIYGSRCFLESPLKKLNIVVLVDRSHNRYPVKADYVGLSMSTTLQEHVTVVLDPKGKDMVYLE